MKNCHGRLETGYSVPILLYMHPRSTGPSTANKTQVKVTTAPWGRFGETKSTISPACTTRQTPGYPSLLMRSFHG